MHPHMHSIFLAHIFIRCDPFHRPIIMNYDGEFLDVEELQLTGPPLFYVLVDLRGSKSTTGIEDTHVCVCVCVCVNDR